MVNRNSNFPVSNSQFPLVSIIVTTKNEKKNIANCLESIKAQNLSSQFPIPNSQSSFFNSQFPISNFYSSIEIIVVDNNSTDKTKEIVEEFKKRFTPLNVQLFNGGPERSAQRNFGVKQASGKYILYLDADMILSTNVISECAGKFNEWKKGNGKQELIALYIPERIVSLPPNESIDDFFNRCNQSFNLCNQSFWMKARNFERSFYNATCIDCVRFIQRDRFLEIGGFDENLTGPEDWDFDRRIKKVGKVGIIDAPIYHNEGTFNLKKYLRKKTYYSKDFQKYIEKWGEKDKIVRKQLGFWYRYFRVFVEDGKWKMLMRHPLLTIGMYFLRAMVGIGYLRDRINEEIH